MTDSLALAFGHHITLFFSILFVVCSPSTVLCIECSLWVCSLISFLFICWGFFFILVRCHCNAIWGVLISSQNLLTLLIEISNWMSCLPAINHFANSHKRLCMMVWVAWKNRFYEHSTLAHLFHSSVLYIHISTSSM